MQTPKEVPNEVPTPERVMVTPMESLPLCPNTKALVKLLRWASRHNISLEQLAELFE